MNKLKYEEAKIEISKFISDEIMEPSTTEEETDNKIMNVFSFFGSDEFN